MKVTQEYLKKVIKEELARVVSEEELEEGPRWDAVKGMAGKLGKDVGGAAKGAASKVAGAAKGAASKVAGAAKGAVDKVQNYGDELSRAGASSAATGNVNRAKAVYQAAGKKMLAAQQEFKAAKQALIDAQSSSTEADFYANPPSAEE